MSPKRIQDVDLKALAPKRAFPSPAAWEDEVFYFALVDRFSDGREDGYRDVKGNLVTGDTPLFKPADKHNAVQDEPSAARWREAGKKYVGGTLKGMRSKLGYLKRLGVTALWVSPVFKQVPFEETYHGYGVQDFLQVNPRFGTLKDLIDLVRTAHENGIYVILDIILNHAANVFAYDPDGPAYSSGRVFPAKGFRDGTGAPSLPFRAADPNNPTIWPDPDSAIWPVELQEPATFTRKGSIQDMMADPEFREGDFFSLKDITHGEGPVDDYRPSAVLRHLSEIYSYWIAVTDVDGYRIDTVKHMDPGATRFFAERVREYATSIGKDRFFLVGEISGDRSFAVDTLEITGLDAALGIADIPDKLEYVTKGYRNPADYFDLFRNSALVGKGTHTWFRDKVMTMINDHDQVSKGDDKARFCADPGAEKVVFNALAFNATTLGIPCIYYGTEQAFDGHGSGYFADRYIREAMFGGEFGAFSTRGVHFFDEEHPVYRELAKVLAIRRTRTALRRGRQYLRAISGDGIHFGMPQMVGNEIRSIVPWSRILSKTEIVLAINTDTDNERIAWVTIDDGLHRAGDTLNCIYSTKASEIGSKTIIEPRNGLSVRMSVPAAGFVIYE